MMNAKKIDIVLLWLMSLLAFFCFYQLYLNRSFDRTSENRLAYIESELNIVKLKKEFYQGWTDANQGDFLTSNDEIYTHSTSGATIKFLDGKTIELAENSLIKIKSENKKETLLIEKGNVIAKLTKDNPILNLQINGKTFSLHSDNAKIQIDQNKNENKFFVLDGKVELKSSDKKLELTKNDIITNDENNNFKKSRFNSEINFPENNYIKYYNLDSSINFQIKRIDLQDQTKIIIARDRLFKSIIHEESIQDEVKINFNEEGVYYYKFISSQYSDSPIFKLQLIKEKSPQLNVKKEIIYKTKNDSFIEATIKNNSKLKIQFDLVNSKGETKSYLTNESSIKIPLNDLGSYVLKAKISDTNHPEAIYSDVKNIEYKLFDQILIESNSPLSITKVSYNNQIIKNRISFKSNFEDASYHIQISKNEKNNSRR